MAEDTTLIYALLIGALTAALYANSAVTVNPTTAPAVIVIAFAAASLSIYLPRKFFHYDLEDIAPTVLQKLMQRAVIGAAFILALPILTLFLLDAWSNPVLLGELFVYTLLGLFLFQGIGEVITNHIIYLQRTNQYNSNQLFAMLAGMAFLFFTLILYFLAFDLAQPPILKNYVRDMLAITLVLVGYGRAVFLMAHH